MWSTRGGAVLWYVCIGTSEMHTYPNRYNGRTKRPFGEHTLKMHPNSGIQGAIKIVIGWFTEPFILNL